MVVANSIGRFVLTNEEQLLSSERKIPHMLVDMDVEKGLPEEVEVIWDGGSFIQRLDYWKIPF